MIAEAHLVRAVRIEAVTMLQLEIKAQAEKAALQAETNRAQERQATVEKETKEQERQMLEHGKETVRAKEMAIAEIKRETRLETVLTMGVVTEISTAVTQM